VAKLQNTVYPADANNSFLGMCLVDPSHGSTVVVVLSGRGKMSSIGQRAVAKNLATIPIKDAT